MRREGKGLNPGDRGSGARRACALVLAWLVPLGAAALEATSGPPPVPPGAAAGAQVAALAPAPAPASAPARETTGRFALPDAEVHGTFQWFVVPEAVEGFGAGRAPERVGRIEARGLKTAIAAWWDDGELRIFRSETARGTSFACGCRVALGGPPGAARVVAEALACMDLPVGPSGLEIDVTREGALRAPGAIRRAVRGMPWRDTDAARDCGQPASRHRG